VSVAALADADWQRKAEAEKSKPAEYLRIAEAIENFAKCGLTEEAWTAKRDKYLAQCEARRQEGTAYFQAIAKAFQASGMGRRRRKRSDIEMRATNLRDTTTAGYGATDTSSASDLPVPKCGAIRVQLSESCGTTADAQP